MAWILQLWPISSFQHDITKFGVGGDLKNTLKNEFPNTFELMNEPIGSPGEKCKKKKKN